MSRHETFSAAASGRADTPAGVGPQTAGNRQHPALALAARPAIDRRRIRLWFELIVLFAGIPVLMWACWDDVLAWGALGPFSLFSILALLAALAAALLAITPGFSFRRLLCGPVLREWKLILACSVLAALVCTGTAFAVLPERFLQLPFERTVLWIGLLAAYPFLSALPQELIYRVLFFERYGSLFPGAPAAIMANAAAFGFGHLFYMHSLTIAMTAVGGALIGWAYLARGRSVLLAWILHSIAGWLIFSSGLGIYFFSGYAAS